MAANSVKLDGNRLSRRLVGLCTNAVDMVPRLWRKGRPDLVLCFGCGIGDDLMCTIVIHEAARRGTKPIWMTTAYPELFVNNPDVDEVVPIRSGQLALHKLAARRWCTPAYHVYDPATDAEVSPSEHIVQIMCHKAGITGEVTLKPRLYLSVEEQARGRLAERQIVIHPARLAMQTKMWMMDRFQEVARALAGQGTLVQVGVAQDPLLPGVLDLRGKTSLRETAAILSQSALYIGQVGFGMHLARAVDCRGVIIYGGRERPDQSGYMANENLYSAVPCAPCWQMSRCDFDKRCMTDISADRVVAVALRQLTRTGEPLVEDKAVI